MSKQFENTIIKAIQDQDLELLERLDELGASIPSGAWLYVNARNLDLVRLILEWGLYPSQTNVDMYHLLGHKEALALIDSAKEWNLRWRLGVERTNQDAKVIGPSACMAKFPIVPTL